MASAEGTTGEGPVVEVKFEVCNTQYPLVALSAETGCEAELIQLLPRSNGSYTVFQRTRGAPPERVLEFARQYDGFDARVVNRGEESTIIEFRIHGDGEFFTISLTDPINISAIAESLRSRPVLDGRYYSRSPRSVMYVVDPHDSLMEFRGWLQCPACGADGDTDVSIFAYETTIVLECYDCGAIGENTPIHDLDLSKIDVTEKTDDD